MYTKQLEQFRSQNGMQNNPGNISANTLKEIVELAEELPTHNENGIVDETVDIYITVTNALENCGYDHKSYIKLVGFIGHSQITPAYFTGLAAQFISEYMIKFDLQALARIAAYAVRCLEDMGYHAEMCILEKAKCICTRKGEYNRKSQEWEKDESQSVDEIYQPNYAACKKGIDHES